MNAQGLNPCPFCGEKEVTICREDGYSQWWIICPNCRGWACSEWHVSEQRTKDIWNGRAYQDCPEFDATEAAHPAWWRGSDYAYDQVIRAINMILDTGCNPCFGYAPLQELAHRLLDLMEDAKP